MNTVDDLLVRTFLAGHFRRWEDLKAHVRQCYANNIAAEQIRMTLRFLVVSAGYGPCLGAFTALKNGGLLPEQTVGKVGGPPGNAFDIVYDGIQDKVKKAVSDCDAVLGQWIQRHLYGDIFSSPGIPLRLKELMMVAFLAEAHMPSQLYGHCRAAFRLGNSSAAVGQAIRLGFEYAPRIVRAAVKTQDALDTAQAAWSAFLATSERPVEETGAQPTKAPASVLIPEPSWVCIPQAPSLMSLSRRRSSCVVEWAPVPLAATGVGACEAAHEAVWNDPGARRRATTSAVIEAA